MIYTIGFAKVYEPHIDEMEAKGDCARKVGRRPPGVIKGYETEPYPGGVTFKTVAAAERCIADQVAAGKMKPGYRVYGLDCDWSNSTDTNTDERWGDQSGHLIEDTPIVRLVA